MTNIPGYSIVPIRISKPVEINDASPDSRRSSSDSETSPEVELHQTQGYARFQHEFAQYTSALDPETFGGKQDDSDSEAENLIIFQELGRLQPRIASHIVDVQRCVGWNVDPFTKMPKFSDRRVNTTEIYHHCLKVLGRVGKSPEWVAMIAEDRMGFLSSLAIASSHLDMLREAETESPVTLAIKYEVIQMLRNSTMAGHKKTSDLLFMAITQFISCEALYGDRDVLMTHIRGLQCIANLRGGIEHMGWSDELALISTGYHKPPRPDSVREMLIATRKIMILAIVHDFECPLMFMGEDFSLIPHFPNLCYRTPESPVCYQTAKLANLQGAKHCCDAVHEMLLDMRSLTDGFAGCYVNEAHNSAAETLRAKMAFKKQATVLYARLAKRASQPANPYYEIVRIASLIYTTALQHCISFHAALVMLGPELIEKIGDCLLKTDLLQCWYGDMSGVLFWCSLVASSAASPLTSPSERRAARWLRVGAFYCMILLSTDHSKVFFNTAKRIMDIQRILRV
jgi:hypothetical protein